MMEDVHAMVNEQGKQLNMVEVEIEKTNHNVKKAVVEITKVKGTIYLRLKLLKRILPSGILLELEFSS